MQVKKQQLELDMEQQTGSKLGKQYVKAVYCHPAYLTYMLSTSCKMAGWMKHKLESRLPGEISNLRYADDTPLLSYFYCLLYFLLHYLSNNVTVCQFSSVARSCPTVCDSHIHT